MLRTSWPITVLIILNVALVFLLITSIADDQTAHAQVRGGGRDYVVAVGEVQTNFQTLYVIDLSSQRLAALVVDQAGKKAKVVDGRDLVEDFSTSRGEDSDDSKRRGRNR